MFQLVLAVLLIAVSVVIQAAFMSVGLRVLKRAHDRQDPVLQRQPTLVVVMWVLYLLLPIGVDIVMWAAVYTIRGDIPDTQDSLYFSTVTFTTVGYGDIVLDRDSRLLATFEAVNGWIVFGWATALVMIVIQRLYLPGTSGGSR